MVTLYFSGTGNSKFVATKFSKKMNALCFSIEEDMDFKTIISEHDTISFCYPIYESRVPRIMREFVLNYVDILENKKLIILCTQMMFSGDGARCFIDIFENLSINVIYAEHFFMPNNISNTWFLPITNGSQNKKCIDRTNKKISRICSDLNKGIIKKRGFNVVSKYLGLMQGANALAFEKKAASSIRVNNDCIGCKICVKCCPMKNLEYVNGAIIHHNNCTLCYRCVNECPTKAITAVLFGKVRTQYKGLK